jgi:glycosyltransferase involved in cell wall biosynthesis
MNDCELIMSNVAEPVSGSQRPLKVVSISHTALSNGRLRYYPLMDDQEIDLTLIVPERWKEYGRELFADPPSPPLDIRVRPIRFPEVSKAKWYLHFYPGLGRLIEELSPDVLHLWEEPWSVVALHAAWLCSGRFPHTALVIETDQNILRRLPTPFEQIRRRTLRRTDMLIVRQREALDVCRACGYQGPSVIVEYCVDASRFYPADKQASRSQIGVNDFTVGYVGRLIPEKGLYTVLDALRACRQNIYFLLLGEGPERERLEQRARQLGLENRVRFLPAASQEKVAQVLNALDVFILMSRTTPTWKEQFGRVIMEAQACGVPVIGSNSGSIPSVVGKGGWIVEESDTASLSRLLDRLSTSPNEVAAAGVEGVRQASTRFSREAVAADLRTAFVEAARWRRGGAPAHASKHPSYVRSR